MIADDHPPIIDAVSRYLGQMGFPVVATALDGEAALEAVEREQPRVCVADVRMPHWTASRSRGPRRRRAPDTAVLLYSGISDRGLVSDALDAGARGFALKDAPLEDLVRAIDAVAEGGLYIDPVLAAALATPSRDAEHKSLTERERQVLRLLAEGGLVRGDRGRAVPLARHGARPRAACDDEARGAHAHPGGRRRPARGDDRLALGSSCPRPPGAR